MDSRYFFFCQQGFEQHLTDELKHRGITPVEAGSGWVGTANPAPDPAERQLCFPHFILANPVPLPPDAAVNELSNGVLDFFLRSISNERVEEAWHLLYFSSQNLIGLGKRVQAMNKHFREHLRKRMSRVARLCDETAPERIGPVPGLFVFLKDFNTVYVSREGFCNGQRRMADDPAAPSRSYLKVEEAYKILGREPQPDETVVDLGASPGGWSYSAAKRGARVIAIDNGPLKGGASNHPRITHLNADAYKYQPGADETPDWLFCDMVEQPNHVLHMLRWWIANRRCRYFVINLKFGRVDPLALYKEVTSPSSFFAQHCGLFRVRHLFHDRDEFTLTGEIDT